MRGLNDAKLCQKIENNIAVGINELTNCVCERSHLVTSFRAKFCFLCITVARLCQELGLLEKVEARDERKI